MLTFTFNSFCTRGFEKFLAFYSELEPSPASFRGPRNLSFVFMKCTSLLAHRSLPTANNNRWTNAEFRFSSGLHPLAVSLSLFLPRIPRESPVEIMLDSFRYIESACCMLDFEFPQHSPRSILFLS